MIGRRIAPVAQCHLRIQLIRLLLWVSGPVSNGLRTTLGLYQRQRSVLRAPDWSLYARLRSQGGRHGRISGRGVSSGASSDSGRDRQFIQILHEGTHRAIHSLNLRICRFDDVVLVRRVRTASVAQAKVARWQA